MEPTEPESPSAPPPPEDIEALRRENRELKARLDRIEAQRQAKSDVRKKSLRIGWGVLVPILDRQRVVRSFGELSNQVIRFANPNDQPEPRELAESAREFLSNCVRFAVRRRLFFAIFALLAAAVPAIQLWLVLQQNQIVQQQNEFFEIQVYDIVASSMTTEGGDSGKRQMAGLLLANADPTFLHNVVRELFDPTVGNVLTADLAKRAPREATYRGPLLRALARGLVNQRADRDDDDIYAQARPSLELVYLDSAERLPRLLRWSRGNSADAAGEAGVHYYIEQLGEVLREHSRLARTVDETNEFYASAAPLFAALARVRAGTSPLDETLGYNLEHFLIDLAQAPEFGAPEVELGKKDPKALIARGLERLSAGLEKHKIDVAQLGAFVGASTP